MCRPLPSAVFKLRSSDQKASTLTTTTTTDPFFVSLQRQFVRVGYHSISSHYKGHNLHILMI